MDDNVDLICVKAERRPGLGEPCERLLHSLFCCAE
jgi:hypothetical protein